MSCRYSYKNFGDFIGVDDTIVFPKEAGVLQTESFIISEDIILHRNSFDVYKDTVIEYDFLLNGITLNIAFEANFTYQSDISDFCNDQKQNNTIMSIINHENGNAYYKANTKLKNIIIFVKVDFLKKVFQNNHNLEYILSHLGKIDKSKAIKSNATNIKTKLCAHEIYTASYETNLDKIFMQSKVLEILSYEFHELLINNTKVYDKEILFSEYDIEAINKAKNILINNMKNPPSIIELSRLVKLNEFKLKHGFKKIFNTTPYNFLLEYKLHEAKSMLENGEMNVSEIAQEIGYKQLHGFSNAFYKRFGVRPKELMKSRKYYY